MSLTSVSLASAFLSVLAFSVASDVLEFKENDFDDGVKSHPIILVEFYAPWCGHCKNLAPKYEQAATKLKGEIPLAKVDCDAEKALCEKHKVQGFPTLKIFRNGEFDKDYDGPREADGIVKYMRAKAGPSSVEVRSLDDWKRILAKDEFIVLGCFSEGSSLSKVFHQVASAERDNYKFTHTTDPKVIENFNCKDCITAFQPKMFHSKFEPTEQRYKGEDDADKIKEFIKSAALGLCPLRDESNKEAFGQPLVVVYYNVDYEKDAKGTHYWRNRVLKVASATHFKGKIQFSISNKDQFSHELEEFGLNDKKSDKPLVAARGTKGQKYPMAAEFSVENLQQFGEDFLADKLEPYLKSEPVPEKNDEPVKVAVAKSFDELVVNNEKDVLIEFYAPWCGHCKQLAPKYDELAKKLKDEPGVSIVKMDATANDVPPQFEVRGFPTLYWVPKNAKSSPEQYQGGREVKDFIKFIAKESTDELVGYTRDGKKRKKEAKEL